MQVLNHNCFCEGIYVRTARLFFRNIFCVRTVYLFFHKIFCGRTVCLFFHIISRTCLYLFFTHIFVCFSAKNVVLAGVKVLLIRILTCISLIHSWSNFLKAGLHYQSFCDRSLSANTMLDEYQSNCRLWKVFTLSDTWIKVYFDHRNCDSINRPLRYQ